jgi:glycosyltransferase involved in cell wall biosynthesis
MNGKIRILFHNSDGAGVNYFRTQTPAMELERNHSDEFHVEINSNLNFDDPKTIDYLKTFHIIHYHRQLIDDISSMLNLSKILRENGTLLVVDIDDYWELHKKHPLYEYSVENKLHQPIVDNLKIADYVTTTTDLFAEEIRKITKKDNVVVLPNSIDPSWMKQFQNNWKPDPEGRIRITYMAGSSHKCDIEQLEGVFNALSADVELKDKFKVIIAGWDTVGTTSDVQFNEEFGDELKKINLWNKATVDAINKTRGNVDMIPKLPTHLKEKYRNNVITITERPIRSDESVYLYYENILTDNHKIIKDNDYIQWLSNLERTNRYYNEGNFARRWTQKANIYATVLDETDIVIAPLENNKFNTLKSNLKQVECWSRKLPILCTDIPPYNVDGKHMENCILIKSDKIHWYKDWKKYLKKLILDADLRKKLGEQLYTDFSDKYNLETVTKNRSQFYNEIIKKTLKTE